MNNIWFISDTHFGHNGILTFTSYDGSLVRGDRFSLCQEMDEEMIQNWNAVIKPQDKVYHCGDVFMGDRFKFEVNWSRLNGHKRLIIGNHDDIEFLVEGKFFEEVMIWRYFKDFDFIATHIPMQLENTWEGNKKATFNVHGHIHEKNSPTLRHHNICVERTDYKPVHIEDLRTILRKRKDTL